MKSATEFAIGVCDRLDNQPIFRAAPLLWPGILFALACAYARTTGAPDNKRMGALVSEAMTECTLLEADHTIARGQSISSGAFRRALEQAIRDEYGTPARGGKFTIDLSAMMPMGSA